MGAASPAAGSVRPARPGDAAEIGRIAAANDQPAPDSGRDPRYLAHLHRHGRLLVAEAGETAGGPTLAGFAATRRLGGVTLLCDLFVDPARHGRGIGRRLLDRIFDGTADRVTFSSQDPRALPLYARYGLAPRWPLLYLNGDPAGLVPSVPAAARGGHAPVRRVPAGDAATAELAFTGADRGPDYSYWGSLPEGGGLLVERAGEVIAAGAAGRGELQHLATAPGADPAAAVLAALSAFGRSQVALCLPGPHPALGPLLRAGFRIGDFDHYMSTAEGLLPSGDVLSPALA